ncbi:hypothetical protein Ping_2557 [Psychromonas ingrahamii 37]|uniref:SMODS and SLOG-associating 2TM effector domain-containing protein n=1 Tax=Psychromonas ingrahamii (strain DSM 17664 / CCUG 51855 / 37) TaxID=357804 RepID=A1SS03_PSYIN|nr:hypothetical protein [Psychromonas ingrahamii]ABM02268.1 hypothetical protein Ping_0407 [Psychromonas ingrahamii 37]ABM04278.1 hypothetical protein Ping_2557 [Psychromonas ingrahamii 37]
MNNKIDNKYTRINLPPIIKNNPVLFTQSLEINNRVAYHIMLTRRRSAIYHWLHRILAWGVPILSAFVTVLSSGNLESDFTKESEIINVVFYLSAVMTILTSIYSTVQPYERRIRAIKYANKLWHFHTEFPLGMEKLGKSISDETNVIKACTKYLCEKNDELTIIINDFNG